MAGGMKPRAQELVGSWRQRRRYLYVVTAFLMACTAYILLKGLDTIAARTIAETSIYGIVALVLVYVFGASWDDMNKLKAGAQLGEAITPKDQ